MLMRKQMILTVFPIADAFAAIAEFQLRICNFCTSADCTFVHGNSGTRTWRRHLRLKLLLPFSLLSGKTHLDYMEKPEHMQHRNKDWQALQRSNDKCQ